jgi:hypothetical protein
MIWLSATLCNLTRKFLLWFGCCLVVSLFFSTRIYFSQTGMGGPADSYLDAVRQAMPQWFTWGALSLVIIRIDRWIAPEGPYFSGCCCICR